MKTFRYIFLLLLASISPLSAQLDVPGGTVIDDNVTVDSGDVLRHPIGNTFFGNNLQPYVNGLTPVISTGADILYILDTDDSGNPKKVTALDFLGGAAAGIIGNTIWADSTHGGVETGDIFTPYDTIAEALAASSAGDLIVIAPGTYAEALVFPHDLYVKGHGAGGIISIDISSGRPHGPLGDIVYHHGGAVIHGGDNEIANGDLWKFLYLVAKTTADEFTLGFIPAQYDAGGFTFDFDVSNGSNKNLAGVGGLPHLKNMLLFQATDNNFQNLELTGITGPATNRSFDTGVVQYSGRMIDVVTNSNMNIDATSSARITNLRLTGVVGGRLFAIGAGEYIDIDQQGGSNGVNPKNFSGKMSIANGLLTVDQAMSGVITVSRLDSIKLEAGADMTGGWIQGGSADLDLTSEIVIMRFRDFEFTTIQDFLGVRTGSILLRVENRNFPLAARRSYIELLVFLEYCSQKSNTTNDLLLENRGTWRYSNFDGSTSSGDSNIAVPASEDATFEHCNFYDFVGYSIVGRDVLAESGANTAPKFFGSGAGGIADTLVFPLTAAPLKSDQAGTAVSMSGDTTNFRIVKVPAQGGGDDFSALVTDDVFDGNIFEDVDTTPADGVSDTYGFATTTGVSVFVLRSTDPQIATLLGSPAGNLSPSGVASTGLIGIAANITVLNTTLSGLGIAPELTVSSDSNYTVDEAYFGDGSNLTGVDFTGDNFELVATDGSGALTTSPTVNQDYTFTLPSGTGGITLTSGDGSQFVLGCSASITELLDAATGNEVAFSLNYTVNKATSGNDTGFVINQTDTASPGTSLLLDLQQGGISRFNVAADGIATIPDLGGLVVGHTAQITTTGNPSELQVLGTGSGDAVATFGRFSADISAPGVHFVKSRNATIGSNTILLDNDRVGALEFYPDDGVDYQTVAARFRAEVDDASPAAGDIGIAFVWEQMPGEAGALAETMRLAATGDLNVTGDINTTAWTAFTSTIVGWEDPLATHALVNYKKVGNLVYVQFYLEGVSDTTAATFTLPFTQINANGVELKVAIQVQDNGTISTTAGLLVLAANSATVSCFKDMAGAVWTNSGTKRVQGQFWYEAQ